MDTGTHLVIGLSLAGLAHLDPAVASDPHVAAAVLVGTIAGSQAPDLDGLLRFRGNAVYIRNHRGLSHSLPAVFLWSAAITALIGLVFDPLPIWHVAFWVLVAVSFHVFSDCFNTYGTQAARPFTEKWISWNIIHIFDPVLFSLHTIGLLIWAFGLAEPRIIFSVVYGFTALYYVARTIQHRRVERRLPIQDREYAEGDRYTAIPTIHLYHWNVVKRRADGSYRLGEVRNGVLRWVDRAVCDSHPAIEATRSHPDVQAFLYFTSYACAECREHAWGYEVRWTDVRYRHRKQYPFVAVLLLNRRMETTDSYVGWLSESRLEKKLGLGAQ
ncbi:metal-dependent hydrolase [Paenibacillus thermoaerophilus]|uniref:Metal-dependent hydrolase n=1 Tax=Paenibacillus thermoaerophilus TaxID=1215385 RepID=A0ABW2V566_9BACL|nr:metal-dependent hydrolase [Paenibacillus thermoaerophilus]TMV18460.1 metal-dependent hydrolase [Paenibacillus thermoaerophilus]